MSLRGKNVLITAGPTREYWDPVRYLTNASSGTMGIALAQDACRQGARVTLILGPTESAVPPEEKKSLKVVRVVSAMEMQAAVRRNLPGTDIFVGAAAVSDFRPARPVHRKIKRHPAFMSLPLVANPDILAGVARLRRGRPEIVMGFALETDHLLENAAAKLRRKRLDWIVANRTTNIGRASGSAVLLSRAGRRVPLPNLPKRELARRIWRSIA